MRLRDFDDICGKMVFRLETSVDFAELVEIVEFDDFGSENEVIDFILEYLADNIKQEIRYIASHRSGYPYEECIDWQIETGKGKDSTKYTKNDWRM